MHVILLYYEILHNSQIFCKYWSSIILTLYFIMACLTAKNIANIMNKIYLWNPTYAPSSSWTLKSGHCHIVTFDLDPWPWPWHATYENVLLHELHKYAKYEVSNINESKVISIANNQRSGLVVINVFEPEYGFVLKHFLSQILR